jgi:hypothetical protein
MKRGLSIMLVIALLLLGAGSSLAEGSASQTDATAATQAPQTGETQFMGSITAVADGSVTITVMGGGQQPQGGGQQAGGQPSGTAPENGGDASGSAPAQDGSTPQGGNGQGDNSQQGGNGQGSQPSDSQGNGGGMPGGDGQTTPAETQTLTIAVTDTTVITSQDTQTALTAADLSADMMILVTVSGDATSGYTALTIVVQTSQPAPTDAAATQTTGS